MDPILGEIRSFAGPYAPNGWLLCDGSLLNISEYEALYSLIGTSYGGDGRVNFALPDLRGRLATGEGTGPGLTTRTIGSFGGTEQVTLTEENLPAHNHFVKVSTAPSGSMNNPSVQTYLGTSNAESGTAKVYVPGNTTGTTQVSLDEDMIEPAGGNQPHGNIMLCIAINYIICMNGIYPTRAS